MNAIGRLFSIVASAMVLTGALLPWATAANGTGLDPLQLRSQYAFGFGGERLTDVWLESVLFVLAVAAVLILIGAVTGSSPVGLIGSLVAGACVIAFVLQVARLLDGTAGALLDDLGQGVLVAGAGALLAFFCAAVLRTPRNEPALIA
jgi:hypothetical protein